MLTLAKYSFGVGDRFAHQAKAQLRACMLAAEQGAEVIPVWNKSNREHTTIGSEPDSVRAAADAAVQALGWKKPYHVDADHIRLETVDRFIASSDFYTIDVADSIGQAAARGRRESALPTGIRNSSGRLEFPASSSRFETTRADVERIAGKYLLAVQEAGRIYRHIAAAKGEGNFITEVSMDETDSPQTPPELLVILAAHRRREDSGADDRAEVHRPVQQGRGLRRRPRAVREGVQRRPGGDRLCRPANTACRRT